RRSARSSTDLTRRSLLRPPPTSTIVSPRDTRPVPPIRQPPIREPPITSRAPGARAGPDAAQTRSARTDRAWTRSSPRLYPRASWHPSGTSPPPLLAAAPGLFLGLAAPSS